MLVMIRGLLASLQRGQSALEVTWVLDSASVALGQDSTPSCRLILTHYHFHMNLQKKTFLEILRTKEQHRTTCFSKDECCNNMSVLSSCLICCESAEVTMQHPQKTFCHQVAFGMQQASFMANLLDTFGCKQ